MASLCLADEARLQVIMAVAIIARKIALRRFANKLGLSLLS
jgi:hypothetical protein